MYIINMDLTLYDHIHYCPGIMGKCLSASNIIHYELRDFVHWDSLYEVLSFGLDYGLWHQHFTVLPDIKDLFEILLKLPCSPALYRMLLLQSDIWILVETEVRAEQIFYNTDIFFIYEYFIYLALLCKYGLLTGQVYSLLDIICS